MISMFAVVAVVAAAAACGVISSKYLGDDNPIEECAEMIIEKETGVNFDLSPKSPEHTKPTS